MAKLTRWNCFILMYITISHSSGLPQEDERSRMFFGCSSDTKQELHKLLWACKSGTKLTCTAPTTTTTTTTTTTPIPMKCDCGKANTATTPRRLGGSTTKGKLTKGKPSKSTRRRPSKRNQGTSTKPNRIVGGVKVKPPRKYPWQVQVQRVVPDNLFNCGGSIINNQWILTAGHCLGSSVHSLLAVRVGEHIRSKESDDDPVNTRYYNVKRQVRHPDYVLRLDTVGNLLELNYDFALLELNSEIPFNNIIRPVCLPEDASKTYAGVKATVSGWGLTNGSDSRSASDVLMEADFEIVAQSDCKGWGNLPNMQLCTEVSRAKSGCNGDSGGPLVVKEGNTYIQVGVVSYGSKSCPVPGNSNVYGRVTEVLDWIRKTTANGKC